MNKPKAIIVDLDGTLCNTEHRKHHVENTPKNWKAFYDGLVDDKAHKWCEDLVWSIREEMGWKIIFVSGRPDNYRDLTKEWLNLVPSIHSDYELFMRKEGDFRKDSIIKTEIYENEIRPNYHVIFCIDDRKQVVDAWRELGLVCLQCAEGNF